jgi:peptidyl-prolyl cis-trans isomerase C
MHRITLTVFVLLITALLASPGLSADSDKNGKNSETDVVAVVNGKNISQESLQQKLSFVEKRYASQGGQLSDEQLSMIKKDILERMIEKELLYQESKEAGISVGDEKVNSQLEQFKAKFPNDEAYQAQLSQLGYTEEMIRKEIRENMAIQELIEQEIASDIEISDTELKAYYDENTEQFTTPEQVKARHILVKTDQSDSEEQKKEAREEIEAIQKRLEEGEKFEELAKEESEGPSGKKGGDLGYFSKGRMVKPFEEAAFAMEPGNVSDIVETRFGFHLIKVEDKKPASKKGYEEVKKEIRQQIKNEKVKQSIDNYVSTLREKATIELKLPEAGKEESDK